MQIKNWRVDMERLKEFFDKKSERIFVATFGHFIL